MPRSVKELLKEASSLLKHEGRDALREARILLGFYLKKDKLWLMTHDAEMIEDSSAFISLILRRVEGEPIEYITNSVSFYSQDFYAAKGALIARPETEILIDEVLKCVATDFTGHIVEVGIGSGIISIVLAQHLPKAKFSAVDISEDALAVARVNLKKFDLNSRIKLFKGDLLAPITESIDIVVSNPPYIEEGVLLEKPLDFEPQNALFGGTIGDEILKRLIDEVKTREIASLACEMGYDQKPPLRDYIESNTDYNVTFYKDLSGFDRGFLMQKDKN